MNVPALASSYFKNIKIVDAIRQQEILFSIIMIAVVVYKSICIFTFCLFLLVSVSWMVHFFAKIKRTISDIKNILQRPGDPDNEPRLFVFKNRFFKSVLFMYYMFVESLVISSLIIENSFDILYPENNTISMNNNCTIARGSYLHLRYDYKFALVVAIRKGLVVYTTLLFLLILYYFNNIYKLKEKYIYSPKQVFWLIITFLPALVVAIATLFPWTILLDWFANGLILEITFFVGVYYAKKLNIQLKMRQQDLEHGDQIDIFELKTHAQQMKQYRLFIKPIFVVAQILILSKILDEFVREFIGTFVLNKCWIEYTFKIKFGFVSSSEVKKIYLIIQQIVVANVSLSAVAFLVTVIGLNIILIWNEVKSKRKVCRNNFTCSTPLLDNYRRIV